MADDGTDSPQVAPRGPVAVGRSLDINSPADVCMELLVDKLKVLDYERDFCRNRKPYRKPLSRAYFAVPCGHRDEQFFYFTSLAVWLLSLAGMEVPVPKEYDDPNATCTNILSGCKKLGFASATYHTTKLSPGFGKEVCGVLDSLTDYVIEKRAITLKKPVYTINKNAEDEVDVGDDEDMTGTDQVQEQVGDNIEEEEEAYMEQESTTQPAPAVAQDLAEKQILNSKVDPDLWRIELERVTPKLRITVAAEAKDWRSHLDEAHGHQTEVGGIWPDSAAALERLRTDISGSIEKLGTRERFLNETFEHLLQQYRATKRQLNDVQEGYNKRSEGISDRNSELQRIVEQLEEVAVSLSERTNMSGETKIATITNAIKRLSGEVKEMEVRLGVVSHTLLNLSFKSKRNNLVHMQEMSDY